MTERVSFNQKGTAKVRCPKCDMMSAVDVSGHKGAQNAVKINCRCRCGHIFKVLVERRKKERIKTDLSGIYICTQGGRETGCGFIAVSDISQSGVRFKLNPPQEIQDCDMLLAVCFQNDHGQKTLIKEDGVIRNVSGPHIGVEFWPEDQPVEPGVKPVAFYLHRR